MLTSTLPLAVFAVLLSVIPPQGHGAGSEPTPKTLQLQKIGGFEHKTPDNKVALAEVPAYDPLSRRLVVVNGTTSSVDVLNLTDPTKPSLVGSLTSAAIGAGLGSINNVSIRNGIAALAVEAEPRTNNGTVAFVRVSDMRVIGTVTVGAVPDMLTFTPDSRYLLVANEGEASETGVSLRW